MISCTLKLPCAVIDRGIMIVSTVASRSDLMLQIYYRFSDVDSPRIIPQEREPIETRDLLDLWQNTAYI
jgi:hypothetical protein